MNRRLLFRPVAMMALSALLMTALSVVSSAEGSDRNRVEFQLTDEPGRWFKNTAGPIGGSQSLAVARPGVEVRFTGKSHTVHTMTSLIFPTGAAGMPFDTDATKAMVKRTVDGYKLHREVLEGDLIHLRRADGRDLDYWLMVNPTGKEKAALVVFNPLAEDRKKTLRVPLYYAGLDTEVRIFREGSLLGEFELDRGYAVELPVAVAAGKWAMYFFE